MDKVSRERASALGLKRYFSGVACLHGHAAERMVSNGGCSECRRIRQSDARKLDPAKQEQARASFRNWYASNRERALKRSAEWKTQNPEKFSAWQLQYRRKNKARRNADLRKWLAAHPLAQKAYSNNKRAQKRAGGKHTAKDLADILRLQKRKCALCRTSLARKKRDLDHIVPLSRGGSNTKRNLQFLCVECNRRKSDKDQMEFMRSQGMLL